jgi:hypothetical protein
MATAINARGYSGKRGYSEQRDVERVPVPVEQI